MSELILIALMQFLFVKAIFFLFKPLQLLDRLAQWVKWYAPRIISKPLVDCSICMNSFWGLVFNYGFIHYLCTSVSEVNFAVQTLLVIFLSTGITIVFYEFNRQD